MATQTFLRSSADHYRRQQRITAAGLTAARRARRGGPSLARVAATVAVFQEAAAQDAITSVPLMLSEQGISAPPEGRVDPRAFAGTASDGRSLAGLFAQANTDVVFDLMVVTQLQDAARVAAGVTITSRPAVTGYVRMLNPPSCPRCAILAGKFYKWNTGFQRHPRCDCRHIPTSENLAGDLTTNPDAAWRSGQVGGLTTSEQKALEEGADLSQVVNARRSLYVDTAGRRLTREGTTRSGLARSRSGTSVRPTPEQIYIEAGDNREEAIRLLRRHAYLL